MDPWPRTSSSSSSPTPSSPGFQYRRSNTIGSPGCTPRAAEAGIGDEQRHRHRAARVLAGRGTSQPATAVGVVLVPRLDTTSVGRERLLKAGDDMDAATPTVSGAHRRLVPTRRRRTADPMLGSGPDGNRRTTSATPPALGGHGPRRVCWVDIGVAVAAGSVAVAALLTAAEPGSRPADGIAVALLVAASAVLLGRRRWPLSTAVGTIGLTLVYLALGYPGAPELPVLLVALYSVAAAGHRWWTGIVVAVFGGCGAVYRAAVEREPALEIALTVVLLVLAFLLGDSVSTRRRLRVEVQERLRAAAVEQELEAQARVSRERIRIAQELHDVMAHTVTTMTVHAGVAADLLHDEPEQARRSLMTMRAAAREAMAELRATVSVLRSGGKDSPLHSAPGLAELDDLVRNVEAAGLPVGLTVEGGRRTLPAALELTVYRVVQEALTNVMRHAGASRATVHVRFEHSHVVVAVEDDGRGQLERAGQRGAGLIGLQERAGALGGTVTTGRGERGGFRVQAVLPAGAQAR